MFVALGRHDCTLTTYKSIKIQSILHNNVIETIDSAIWKQLLTRIDARHNHNEYRWFRAVLLPLLLQCDAIVESLVQASKPKGNVSTTLSFTVNLALVH